jgi:hypothetical protein
MNVIAMIKKIGAFKDSVYHVFTGCVLAQYDEGATVYPPSSHQKSTIVTQSSSIFPVVHHTLLCRRIPKYSTPSSAG